MLYYLPLFAIVIDNINKNNNNNKINDDDIDNIIIYINI